MRLIFLLVLTVTDLACSSDLVDGVVNIKCGSQEENMAQLSYFGDSLQVSAFTKDGTRCPFKQNIATATWSLSVSFSHNDEGRCVMAKIPHRRIYSIDVMSFRSSPEFESEDDEKFLMECNFETYKEEVEDGLSVVDGSLASPHVIENHEGKQSDSNFSISIVHNDGHRLTSMEVGRIARLKVTMTPSVEEQHKGFMPVKCEVMTPNKTKRSVILADGCGTGYPFHQDQGFHMDETVGLSPPFRMFRLNPKQGLAFKCSFVTCEGDCKGSTCPAERTIEEREKRAVTVTAPSAKPSEANTTLPEDKSADVTPQIPGKNKKQEQENAPEQAPTHKKQKVLVLNSNQMAELAGQGNQQILLIGRLDARAFSRTVKLAVFGTSAFVLCVFVLLTLYIICKFRRIEQ